MEKVARFQKLVESALTSINSKKSPAELYEPVSYFMSLGGKRMRPVLTLLACDLFGGKEDNAINAAIAIELFHNFTLVHDDIMDNAPVRRGKTTVHEKWNTNIAILSGDVIMVKAYEELCKSNTEVLPRILEVFNSTAIEVCEGQQLDMNFEELDAVSIDDYINMIKLKTSVLLAGSLKIGALLGGATEKESDKLYEFGKNIGIAFQLQDDILDVFGEKAKVGKQVGGDIVANKKTFLLLKALELAKEKPSLLNELNSWMKGEDVSLDDKVGAVTNIFMQLDVQRLAKLEMDKYYKKALVMLDSVDVPKSKKQDLLSLADNLMQRDY